MSFLRLVEIGSPGALPPGEHDIYVDSAPGRHRLLMRSDDGYTDTLSSNGLRHVNFLTNGSLAVQQRVAIASTAIPSVSLTSRAGRVADRWAVTVGNITTCSWQQVDTAGAPEAGLLARYYGRITQAGTAAKFIFSQFIPNSDMTVLRGTSVRLSLKIKQFVGLNAVYRLGLLRLGAAGTPDVDPAFISAIGANGVDPTWGTNLALVTPTAITPEGGTVSGTALNITSTAGWVRSSVIIDIPTDCENLVFVLFRDTVGAVGDSLGIAELQITGGQEVVDWITMPAPFDISRCLRFFTKSFPSTVVPAAALAVATAGYGPSGILGKAGSGVALAAHIDITFPLVMHRTPTVTLFTPVAAGAAVYRHNGVTPAVQGATALVASSTTDFGCIVAATSEATVNGAVGDLVSVHYTADAEFVN